MTSDCNETDIKEIDTERWIENKGPSRRVSSRELGFIPILIMLRGSVDDELPLARIPTLNQAPASLPF